MTITSQSPSKIRLQKPNQSAHRYIMAIKKIKFITLPVVGIAMLLSACAGPELVEPQPPIAYPSPPDAPRFYFEETVFGADSIKTESGNDRLRRLLTGASANEGIRFGKPFDIAVHQGRVFVSDTVQRTVLAMDFTSGQALKVGDSNDEGDLFKPLGIAVSDQGKLFVCDTQLLKVLVYNRDGEWLYSIDLKTHMKRPSGIDVTPDGSTLYVVDTGGVDTDQHNIRVFNAENGSLLRTIGKRGTKSGEFNLPRDVAVGTDGLIYVTDGANFRVQALDKNGNMVRSWGGAGRQLGQFSRPKGIATDKDGNLYVVDTAFGNFQIFSPQGELLMFIGKRSEIHGPGIYMLPAGIDVDEDGRVYVVDQFFSKLEIFRPAGLLESDGYLGRSDAGN